MAVAVEELRLGRYQAMTFDQGAASWAIVLPGAGYSAQAPMLWYARRAALAAGRSVLVVTDAFDRERDDPLEWVEARCAAAFRHVQGDGPRPLLIAKSLTSLAARFAAAEGLPAVWLTPLIADRGSRVAAEVLAGLRAGTEARLLVGGSEDPSWDGAVAATLSNAEILELRDADHSLEVPADVTRSLDNLKRVADAVGRFTTRLA